MAIWDTIYRTIANSSCNDKDLWEDLSPWEAFASYFVEDLTKGTSAYHHHHDQDLPSSAEIPKSISISLTTYDDHDSISDICENRHWVPKQHLILKPKINKNNNKNNRSASRSAAGTESTEPESLTDFEEREEVEDGMHVVKRKRKKKSRETKDKQESSSSSSSSFRRNGSLPCGEPIGRDRILLPSTDELPRLRQSSFKKLSLEPPQ